MVELLRGAVVEKFEKNQMSPKVDFANIVKSQSQTKEIKTPTCLNFVTKTAIKRSDDVEKLKELKYPLSNVIGIAEMRGKGSSFDITCKIRQNVLQLQETMNQDPMFQKVKLYESDKVFIC